MSTGKIDDLVSQKALDQLDQLYQRLGITKDQMVSATEQAAKFTAALGDTKSLQDFTAAQAKASEAMQNVIANNTTIIAQQKEITIQTQAVTDAVKIKVALDANADQVLKQVGGTLDANIKQLIQQKIELKNVNAEISALSKQYAGTVQSQNSLAAKTAELTGKQLALKEAVAQQNLIIKQQVKENNAAETSQDAMLARLNLLRKAFNSLSEEERNNAQVGGVMRAEIIKLSEATKAINESQGKYNDSVGDYENKIKSAIAAYVPYGNQIVKAIDTTKAMSSSTVEAGTAAEGMAAAFGGVAAGGVAILAIGIASITSYLSQFGDVALRAEQVSGGLKNVFTELGHSLVDGDAWGTLKSFLKGDFAGAGAKISMGSAAAYGQGVDITKAIQGVQNLNAVNDQLILKQQAQADQFRAQSKDVALSYDQRIAKIKEAQSIENKVLSEQKNNAQSNIDAALKLADKYGKVNPNDRKTLASGADGAIALANKLYQNGTIVTAGYEMLMQGYQRQTQTMNAANMKLIRQQNDEAKLNLKSDKDKLKSAKELSNDELELQKAKLQGEKETAQLILNDNKQSYEARYAALSVFTERSKALVGIENTIANRAPGISGTKKAANNQIGKNQNAAIDNFDLTERQKIQQQINDEVKAEQKKLLDSYKANEKAIEDVVQNGLNEQLLELDLTNSDKILKVTEAYSKGIISEKNYHNQVNKLQKDAAAEAIDIQVKALEKIAEAQTAAIALGFGDPKALQSTGNRITGLKIQSNNLKTGALGDQATGDKLTGKEKLKETLGYTEKVIEGLDIASGLIAANAQAKIDGLEKEFDLIQRNGEAEKTRIGNSLLSEKEKARQQNIVDGQVAQQRVRITQQENEAKKKQAEFDKAMAIARIIQATAVAVTESLPNVVLAAIVGALGAAQLAVAIATPLPQFEKGGTVKKDGHIITGEAGTELRIDPSGKTSFTADHANVSYAKAGTKIINNKDLVKMLGKPDQVQYVVNATNDNKRVEKLLEENNSLQRKSKRPVVNIFNDKFGSTYTNRNY